MHFLKYVTCIFIFITSHHCKTTSANCVSSSDTFYDVQMPFRVQRLSTTVSEKKKGILAKQKILLKNFKELNLVLYYCL